MNTNPNLRNNYRNATLHHPHNPTVFGNQVPIHWTTLLTRVSHLHITLYSQYLNGDMDYFSWLHELRLMLRNHHPIVSGTSKTEEQVYDEANGPGQDIYNKAA